MVEANAVRNAVTSSALMSPVVLPTLSSKVKEPRIVDVEPLLSASAEGAAFASELIGVDEGVVSIELAVVDIESCLDAELIELRESPELIVKFSVSAGRPAVSGGTILTTFTPCPDMPLAGMKRVVEPSLRLR